jgi:hypothetical protein
MSCQVEFFDCSLDDYYYYIPSLFAYDILRFCSAASCMLTRLGQASARLRQVHRHPLQRGFELND